MKGLGPSCGPPRAVVIGNLNVDLMAYGVENLPGWGEEKTCRAMTFRTAGSAGYTALALGRLGMKPLVLGNVGRDRFGSEILADLTQAGADTSRIFTTDSPTGLSIAMVNPDGERAFVTFCGHLGGLRSAEIIAGLDALPPGSPCLLAGYFLLPALGPDGAVAVLKHCRHKGALTLLDTGDDPRGWTGETLDGLRRVLAEVDILLPNLQEAQTVSGRAADREAAAFLHELGPGVVIVKEGARGSLYSSAAATLFEPALPVSARDTTGAGDSFNAGIICALLRGFTPRETLRLANAIASLTVSRRSDEERFPSAAEVQAAFDHSG